MSTLNVPKDRIQRDVPEVIEYCVREIRNRGDIPAERPPNQNELHKSAVAMMVHLVEVQERIRYGVDDPQAEAELYQNADELASTLGTIMVQAGTSEKRKGRTKIHELATHLQRTRVAQDVYGVDQVLCNVLDGRKVRHYIARRVEDEFYD